MRTRLGQLTSVVLAIVLAPLPALAQTADLRLQAYLDLAQYASPYAGAAFPEQWCYYTKTDRSDVWWYFDDPVTGRFTAIRVQNAFGIPFAASGAYSASGAIVVGYAVDGGPPPATGLSSVSFSSSAADCLRGLRILTNGPYPIDGLAADIALQTAADPAPEYRVWQAFNRSHNVRLISAIPVSFQTDAGSVAGRILLGFSSNW